MQLSRASLYSRLSLLMFLQFFVWGSWFVTLGTYMLQTLQFSGRQVGMVYGSMAIAATVTPFALGILADRVWASDRMLAFLSILGAGLLYLAAQQQTFLYFYLAMLVYMFIFMPTFSLVNSLCFHHLTNTTREFPRIRVWGTVSWIMAGILVSYLQIEDKSTPLLLASGLSLLQGAYCFTLPHTPPMNKGKDKAGRVSFWGPEVRQLLTDRNLLVLLLCIGLIRIPSSYYYSFVNPFLNETGVANAAGKMSAGQITEILMIVILPTLLLRVRLKYIIFTGLMIWGGRYLCFAYGSLAQEWIFFIGIAVHGTAYAFATLTTQIYLDRRVPPELRASAQGFFTLLTQGAGALLGAFIAGETVSRLVLPDGSRDWHSIWLVPATIGIATAILFLLLFRNKKTGTIG